ncbi:MAG TPA: GNAT family protein [Steroidobacteraceae bacterium]|nr:GNAT family protein [Steroidobacteraceae bacterium]
MEFTCPRLEGAHVRLEPLERSHIEGLHAAAGQDLALYQWSFVPLTLAEMARYVDSAITSREAGTTFPFATVRSADGVVIGSTRFFDIERWQWPAGHREANRPGPDGCEIGYTWLARDAIRTAANTEAKLLMLTHAFEAWRVHRVCFHTDARNERSRAALTRIGARFEGVLRAHRLASDLTPRDSARFSIIAAEWPAVKERLRERLSAHGERPVTTTAG